MPELTEREARVAAFAKIFTRFDFRCSTTRCRSMRYVWVRRGITEARVELRHLGWTVEGPINGGTIRCPKHVGRQRATVLRGA